jgi:hypothetical protein
MELISEDDVELKGRLKGDLLEDMMLHGAGNRR